MGQAGPPPPPVVTTCDGVSAAERQEAPAPVPPPPTADTPACEPDIDACHHLTWTAIWGTVGMPVYFTGSHEGANGVPFNPLFGLDFDLNIGLLPNKELYLFAENKFWTQKAAPGITNPSQGQFDFSKREYDLWLGGAWTYYSSFEFRAWTYALSNLNRGDSLSSPFGFKDGVAVENRYYLNNADIYDVGRLSFLSVGYYASKDLVGNDGSSFKPGLFARAYLTYDIKAIRSYVYFDGEFTAEQPIKPRLLEMDVGLAARPFLRLQNLEFRLGIDVTADVQAGPTRDLFYGAVRFGF